MKNTIGFTGTQVGMSERQTRELYRLLCLAVADGDTEFRHGDCVGADEESHQIAITAGVKRIVIHPPTNTSKRAWCRNWPGPSDYEILVLPGKPYLERNKDIVVATTTLIATPKTDLEELRSGTWSTVRFARKMQNRNPLNRWIKILPR